MITLLIKITLLFLVGMIALLTTRRATAHATNGAAASTALAATARDDARRAIAKPIAIAKAHGMSSGRIDAARPAKIAPR